LRTLKSHRSRKEKLLTTVKDFHQEARRLSRS